jgi:hypothetical protein
MGCVSKRERVTKVRGETKEQNFDFDLVEIKINSIRERLKE